MAEEGVKLLGVKGSPFSCRVEIALKLKGVDYEHIQEDLSNKSPLLLKYNPIHKKIPVLVHDGKPICESLVILEYIDETWEGNPILPRDPYQRAVARFWAQFVNDKCIPGIWQAFSSREEKAMKEAHDHLKALEGELKGNKFFGGDRIGIVDIAACFIAFWLGAVQEASGVHLMTHEDFPLLCKWADEFVSVGTVKECLLPREAVVGFFKAKFEAKSKDV